MKTITLYILAAAFLFTVGGCQQYVQDIDPQINNVDDELLNNESQINFLVTGVEAQFNRTYSFLAMYAGGLSDELVFDRNVPGATYPQFQEIENGIIYFNNNSVIEVERFLGQLRLLADTLVGRVSKITFTKEENRAKALYYGNLFGGIARYFYGAYFGLEQTRGGGTINLGPFIPSDMMYQLALDKLMLASENSLDNYTYQLAYSIMARIELIRGNYAKAKEYAEKGLAEESDPFQALFSTEDVNPWWIYAGNGRTQFVADHRFYDYITADAGEAARLPLLPKTGQDGVTEYHYQNKFPEDKSPSSFITWQENSLILAECAVRAGDNTTALTHINSVRSSHGLAARTETSLDSIYIERDKELFCMGQRLIDQRRFNRWHLPPGTWEFLPITQQERNANPNLK